MKKFLADERRGKPQICAETRLAELAELAELSELVESAPRNLLHRVPRTAHRAPINHQPG